MAYHVLAQSLQDVVAGGGDESRRLAQCLQSSLQGHVPLSTFHQWGAKVSRAGVSECRLLAGVSENLRLDLNPFGQCLKSAQTPARLIDLHGKFNQRSRLQIRSTLKISAGGRLHFDRRSVPAGLQDPAACQQVHVAAMECLLKQVESRAAEAELAKPRPSPGAMLKISDVARHFNPSHSLIREFLQGLEEDPASKVTKLATRLGFPLRTMQRSLAQHGLTAELLKRSVMHDPCNASFAWAAVSHRYCPCQWLC